MKIENINETAFKFNGGVWVIEQASQTSDNVPVFIIKNVLTGELKLVFSSTEVVPVQTVYVD